MLVLTVCLRIFTYMAKVLILPDYNGQDLPSEGLDRYEHVYLVTEQQESLPIPVVMKLMKIMQQSHVNIEFLELSYNSETELLLSMAFLIARLNMTEPDIQVTFVTENLIFDTLVATAKQNSFKVQRAKGFNSPSAIPSGPSEVQKPVQPSIVQNSKPMAQPKPVQEKPVEQEEQPKEPAKKNNNQRLISSLLNGNK